MQYVLLGKFSSQFAAKQQQRGRAVRAKARALGIRFVGVYFTQGEYDVVAIAETEDVGSILAYSLWYAQKGFGRLTTLPAFDEAAILAASRKV